MNSNYLRRSLVAIAGAWCFAGATVAAEPEAVKPRDAAAVAALQRAPGAILSLDRATGAVQAVRLEAGVAGDLSPAAAEAPLSERAVAFFEVHAAAFGISDARAELALATTRTDRLGWQHLVLEQRHAGVPVFGGQLRAHFDGQGRLRAVNGRSVPGLQVGVTPRLDAAAAETRAIAAVRGQKTLAVGLVAQGTRLMVYRTNLLRRLAGQDHLVYEVEVTNGADVREALYVDARNGKVVDQFTRVHDAAGPDRRAFDAQGAAHPGPNYPGTPYWVEGDAFPTASGEANNMIQTSGETWDLFFATWGQDSIDGSGAVMDAIFNRGDSCPNASWNGTYISFCPGITTDDVTGHEWGHAYDQYSSNLIYQWQSGALDESYSDVWGEIIDLINGRDVLGTLSENLAPRTGGSCTVHTTGSGDNSLRWLMGEDSTATGLVGALRDMWKPSCYGDPDKVTDTANYRCSTADQGGVHSNSGVPNHFFALLADGGSYNGQTITGIGLLKAAHIVYRAQHVYHTPISDFGDHADAVEASCADLIGAPLNEFTGGPSSEVIGATDCEQVAKAALAVELRTPPDCGFEKILATGQEVLCGGRPPVMLLDENFESGAAGWTTGYYGVYGEYDGLEWTLAPGPLSGHPGLFAFAENDPDRGDCSPGSDDQSGVIWLDSPIVTVPAGGHVPLAVFDHNVATEAGWDGGNVWINVNSGGWVLLGDDAFQFNGYNGTLIASGSGNTNPMAGERAFTGSDEGSNDSEWGQSVLNLSNYAKAGDTVQLSFEFGNDGCGGRIGWAVDNVKIYSCGVDGGSTMVTPVPGTALPTRSKPTTTFTWTAGGADQFWISMGTTPGGQELHYASNGSSTTLTKTLPTTSGDLWVRLWFRVAGVWRYSDYRYTTGELLSSDPVPGVITAPVNGATLTNTTETFTWNAGSGTVTSYWLGVSTTGFASSSENWNVFYGSVGTATSQMVTGLPDDGRPVYVRLWTLVDGVWLFNDALYTGWFNIGSTLYSLGTPSGSSRPVQDFEPAFDFVDSEGADDFTVPPGQAWKIRRLATRGVSSTGVASRWPIDGLWVTFYADAGGVPGNPLCSYSPIVPVTQNTPTISDPVVNLPAECRLNPGRYWVGVLAREDFSTGTGSQWYWNTTSTVTGYPGTWRNPGDGFGTGCTTWAPFWACFGELAQRDFVFSLSGLTEPTRITSPPPGGVINGTSTTFVWTAVPDATQYWLGVSTSGDTGSGESYDLFYASTGTNLSQAVSGLPANNSTVYVRLWYRVGGVWKSESFTYTSAP